MEDTIVEINDIAHRARNIILYRVPEGKGSNANILKRDENKGTVNPIFGALVFNTGTFIHFQLYKTVLNGWGGGGVVGSSDP